MRASCRGTVGSAVAGPQRLASRRVVARTTPAPVRPVRRRALQLHGAETRRGGGYARRLGRVHATEQEAEEADEEAEVVVTDGSDIPDEVWEAEAKSAPGRNIRLGIYAAVGGGSGLLAVGRINFLAAQEVRTLFDAIWPALDIGAVGLAAYLAWEDLKNRDENVARIWSEVKKRQALAPAKAKGKGKGMGASKGFGGKAVVVPAVVADSAPAEKGKGGIFSGVKNLVAEANAEARIQALQMNSTLEEKGLISKLKPPPDKPKDP